MPKIDIPHNVLALRYASKELVTIWGERNKIFLERCLWIVVMKAQAEQGAPIPPEAIQSYEAVATTIDLESIRRREERLRHDVMARIEEFNALAGYQYIHLGMTSRDLTDNVEQWQIRQSLQLVHFRTISLMHRMAAAAAMYKTLDICGRTHLMPGQTITLGKRLAMWTEVLYMAFIRLEYLIHTYPLRGIKGAMGTQQDMAAVVSDPGAVESKVREALEFASVLIANGQVYPRSLDFLVASHLLQLADAPANFANMVRLMAYAGLMHEGFGEDQKGSSAMPHKRNARTSERINGTLDVLRSLTFMLAELIGKQWFEGDVSCSVPRRVALSDSFFALDGIFESAMTILDEMEVFPAAVSRELATFLPFLSTTRVLTAALKQGVGREDAHAIIREHSLAALKAMQTSNDDHRLAERLGADPRLKLTPEEIYSLMHNPNNGSAVRQTERICAAVFAVSRQYPEAVAYVPERIL